MVVAMPGDDGGIRWHFLEGWGEQASSNSKPPPETRKGNRSFVIAGTVSSPDIPAPEVRQSHPPKMSDNHVGHNKAGLSRKISLRLSAEIAETLDAAVGKRGSSVSDIVRRLIESEFGPK
jgi:hypothetical protein